MILGSREADVWRKPKSMLSVARTLSWKGKIPYFRSEGSCKQAPRLPLPRKKYTFYGHEVVSTRMVKKIMERLKFPKKETELVEKLVRTIMFFSDTELITLSAVRRIIVKVGKENIWL